MNHFCGCILISVKTWISVKKKKEVCSRDCMESILRYKSKLILQHVKVNLIWIGYLYYAGTNQWKNHCSKLVYVLHHAQWDRRRVQLSFTTATLASASAASLLLLTHLTILYWAHRVSHHRSMLYFRLCQGSSFICDSRARRNIIGPFGYV